MDPRLFILAHLHDACRSRTLCDLDTPSWSDAQFFRACMLRLERADALAWDEFLQHIGSDRKLAFAVRAILVDRFVVLEQPAGDDMELLLPAHVGLFTQAQELQLLQLLSRERDLAVFPDPAVHFCPQHEQLYKVESAKKFLPPSNQTRGEIMYIEMKVGLTGPSRIGRVQRSKTGKTIYFAGKTLQSLKGGYKANYFDVATAMHYWISGCRKDGNDTLYPGVVEIDEDAREEYWTEIRQQPENRHLSRFRSPGKYAKHRPA